EIDTELVLIEALRIDFGVELELTHANGRLQALGEDDPLQRRAGSLGSALAGGGEPVQQPEHRQSFDFAGLDVELDRGNAGKCQRAQGFPAQIVMRFGRGRLIVWLAVDEVNERLDAGDVTLALRLQRRRSYLHDPWVVRLGREELDHALD